MTEIYVFETIAVVSLLFFVLVLYIIVRQNAFRFLFQIGLALLLAYMFKLLGYAEFFAFIGVGITLSLAYFMKK